MSAVKDAKRVVVKVGTSTLTYENGRLNLRRVESLCRVLSDLKNSGREIVLVTSGAIGVGAGHLGLKERPRDIGGKQAAAAVGQCELMYIYDKRFGEYGHITAQVLLTRDVVEDPVRKGNVVNTLTRLLEYGTVPIINENDTVAVDEIEFGDNDTLSAMVAELIGADALVLLTDIDGLFDADPHVHADAHRIPVVHEIDDSIRALAGEPDPNGAPAAWSPSSTPPRWQWTPGSTWSLQMGRIWKPFMISYPAGTWVRVLRPRRCKRRELT